MNGAKVVKVFEMYGIMLNQNDVVAEEMSEQMKYLLFRQVSRGIVLRHIAYMCETAIGFVHDGHIEKAMRWLGFVQSALYFLGFYTIDDLKEHSRPRPEDE